MIKLNANQSCQVMQQLASWIDTQVIALAICDYLDHHELEINYENGKAVWLEMLERLSLSINTPVKSR